jgi:putative ABC transport system ATP-binding protein
MVLEALKNIQRERKSSVLLITHNAEIAKIADIVITLRNGEVQNITKNASPLSPTEVIW